VDRKGDGLPGWAFFTWLFWITSGEDLCRWRAGVQGTGNETSGKNLRGGDKCCCKEARDAVKSDWGLAGCLLIMAYKTDGAVVVICLIKMIMRRCRERGEEKQKDEENGQMTASVYGARSKHERTLNDEVGIVKKLISFVRSLSMQCVPLCP
jgi:hypothetical protein